MSLYEFLTFSIYLGFLFTWILIIQMTNPGKQLRESLHPETIKDTSEDEMEKPFNPEEENYMMTENPMFSHQDTVESKED